MRLLSLQHDFTYQRWEYNSALQGGLEYTVKRFIVLLLQSEAELYRLKGELTLQSKGQSPRAKVEAEAEECFHRAIDIDRRQSAKSLELRAVMSLSRVWQQQGRRNEARQMLAEIYGWFTEGFDTKDLQEAKLLLQELA